MARAARPISVLTRARCTRPRGLTHAAVRSKYEGHARAAWAFNNTSSFKDKRCSSHHSSSYHLLPSGPQLSGRAIMRNSKPTYHLVHLVPRWRFDVGWQVEALKTQALPMHVIIGHKPASKQPVNESIKNLVG